MSKTYRSWNPDQDYLLPPSPRDWLPENDLIYFVLNMVKELGLSAITVKYEVGAKLRPLRRVSPTSAFSTTYVTGR